MTAVLSAGFYDRRNQVDTPCGACDCRIKPTVEILARCILRHISEVYIHILPLSALSLVSCDSIGVFDLQRVEIWVATEYPHRS